MSRSERDYEHLDNVQELPGHDDWLDKYHRKVSDEGSETR